MADDKTKESNRINYQNLKESGYSAVHIVIPIDIRDRLAREAHNEGLTLTAYCRGVLCGKEYRNLRERKYVR